MVGNPKIIAALKKVKSYMDYGIFQPIQIAAISALNGPQECVGQINEKVSIKERQALRRALKSWMAYRKTKGNNICLGKDTRAVSKN